MRDARGEKEEESLTRRAERRRRDYADAHSGGAEA